MFACAPGPSPPGVQGKLLVVEVDGGREPTAQQPAPIM